MIENIFVRAVISKWFCYGGIFCFIAQFLPKVDLAESFVLVVLQDDGIVGTFYGDDLQGREILEEEAS